jgi:hypothetical protein
VEAECGLPAFKPNDTTGFDIEVVDYDEEDLEVVGEISTLERFGQPNSPGGGRPDGPNGGAGGKPEGGPKGPLLISPPRNGSNLTNLPFPRGKDRIEFGLNK